MRKCVSFIAFLVSMLVMFSAVASATVIPGKATNMLVDGPSPSQLDVVIDDQEIRISNVQAESILVYSENVWFNMLPAEAPGEWYYPLTSDQRSFLIDGVYQIDITNLSEGRSYYAVYDPSFHLIAFMNYDSGISYTAFMDSGFSAYIESPCELDYDLLDLMLHYDSDGNLVSYKCNDGSVFFDFGADGNVLCAGRYLSEREVVDSYVEIDLTNIPQYVTDPDLLLESLAVFTDSEE